MVQFKEFRVGDLFDIHPTTAYKLRNADLFSEQGKNRVVTNSSVNNGVTGWSGLDCTESGNKITFSDTTTSDAIFYQPFDFIGYPHVQGLYAKQYKDNWNEKTLLYIVALMRRNAAGRFDYATKFTRKLAAEMCLILPVVQEWIPDWDALCATLRVVGGGGY